MWDGTVEIGEGWAFYRGRASDQSPHSHASVQIASSDTEEIKLLRADGETICSASIIVAPLIRHQLPAIGKPVRLIYLDACSSLARAILTAIEYAPIAAAALSGLYQPAPSPNPGRSPPETTRWEIRLLPPDECV